eukprot:CAMPEP_0171654116 /NCGR_PEP_ID=MMETSP0990-20121206/40004_1 /TAXON_ID=483369 /ORGANISM="non described non described, Strain CCMP2098" /LENGTH=169 /DNA_ID=CAMNT_0012233757 /DNA_START=432 /DNA_END=937 /DNA_ORIENTATION=+
MPTRRRSSKSLTRSRDDGGGGGGAVVAAVVETTPLLDAFSPVSVSVSVFFDVEAAGVELPECGRPPRVVQSRKGRRSADTKTERAQGRPTRTRLFPWPDGPTAGCHFEPPPNADPPAEAAVSSAASDLFTAQLCAAARTEASVSGATEADGADGAGAEADEAAGGAGAG